MHTIEEYQKLIQSAIEKEIIQRKPRELYDPIIYTLAIGGKRLRPMLTMLTCDIFDGDIQQAIYPALGLETFHNFTLLHDDIMDNAPIRRGLPTVYKKWDSNTAILSGDTMMVMAYDFILASPKDLLFDIFTVFNRVGREVCEGQQYDLNFETNNNVTLDEYLKMIHLKTAVLLGGSMQVGALIARTSEKNVQLIYDLGESVGMAFQLQDDLLDVFGDEEVFGKKNGGDIRTNKKTFLYIKALELGSPEQQKELKQLFNIQEENDNKVKRVLEIFQELNIEAETHHLMDCYYDRAMKTLEKINLDKVKKSILIKLADSLMNRNN
ncbi:MAG: polyprenyl synthetase family protein [Bacteroidales bacterium]|jgi:geranylgeranyl diphosphate synthase type II|nr:polyprenyl synthetase family protein [Bacteroidales bacterium]